MKSCDLESLKRFLTVLAVHGSSQDDLEKVTEAVHTTMGGPQAKPGAATGTIPWATILLTILPFLLQIFTGGTVNIQALIAAILALINPPTPTPPTP